MTRTTVAIALTKAERAELERLASRRRPAQGPARRARIALAAAEGLENQVIAEAVGADMTRLANGVGASPSDRSTDFMTSRAAARDDTPAMMKLPRRSA